MNPDDTGQAIIHHQDRSSDQPSSPGQPPRATFWAGVREWAGVIVIALAIAVPVRFFIAEPFIVNGASMDPTFSTGQFLVVDRLTYRFETPQRGDVIVFQYPNDPSVYYIKRIIGLPGEQVRLNDGHVTIIHGTTTIALDEPYVAPYHASHDNGVFPPDGKPLRPSEYFVMGDNRAESSDSRVWGPLEYHFIVGRALIRLTPLSAISLLPGDFHEATSTAR